MQIDPISLQLIAQTRLDDRLREAADVRLADSLTAEAPRRGGGLRGHLASALYGLANRLQPAVTERKHYAYR